MSKKKKVYKADFKAKVVLELLESGKTLNEVASKNDVLPNTLISWKRQFLENMSLAFDKSSVVKEYKEEIDALRKEGDALAKKLGQTIIEKDWAVGKLKSLDLLTKKSMVDKAEGAQANFPKIPSLTKQLKILGVSKTAIYYIPMKPFSKKADLELLNAIDEIYTEFPYYGHRRIKKQLELNGIRVGKKKVISAMKYMGIKTFYPKPKTTIAIKEHKKYPYLLNPFKNENNQVIVSNANEVWSSDITYIRLKGGFVYLAAIIDWSTKKVLSWKLSNTMDVSLVTSVLNEALALYPKPRIFNTDQGSQYTAKDHIDILVKNEINISMDGKGRSIDNICIERFWRSLKYEDVYLKEYNTIFEARSGIEQYIEKYNTKRLHSSINYQTPNKVYFESIELKDAA